MVAAVSCSVQKEPIVVGKPSSFLMDFLLKRFVTYTKKSGILLDIQAFALSILCNRNLETF